MGSEEPLLSREWSEAGGNSPISGLISGTGVPHVVQKNLFFDFVPLPIGSEEPIPYGDKLYATLEPKKQAKLS